MLSASDAVEIYQCKLCLGEVKETVDVGLNIQMIRGQCFPLAKKYGVSPRTIRDIWNRRTWGYATKHLWPIENEITRATSAAHEESKLSTQVLFNLDYECWRVDFGKLLARKFTGIQGDRKVRKTPNRAENVEFYTSRHQQNLK